MNKGERIVSGDEELKSLFRAAEKIEILTNREISVLKGPRVVEVRVYTPRRRVDINTTVNSMTEWFDVRDTLKQLAAARSIPCNILFM